MTATLPRRCARPADSRGAAAPEHGHDRRQPVQSTRRWYWRLQFPCRLHGGDVCHARAGQHREHAIFGERLLRVGAPLGPGRRAARARRARPHRPPRVPARRSLSAPDGGRPEPDDARGGRADPRARVRAPPESVYLKAMDRKRWAFALVGVAAARYDDGVRLALAGVAPIPWELQLARRARGGRAPARDRVQGRARPEALGRRAIVSITR